MSYLPLRWSIAADVNWIEVNGYPMAYQGRGAGPPLVLVHGSFCDYRIWPDQLEPFSQHHRVLNVSLRHYFPELWDGVGNDFSFAQHADDVGVFVEKLDLGPVHLLGASRGGAVAIEVAKKYPDFIRTLILADAGVRLELPETEANLTATAFRSKLFADLRKDVSLGDVEGGTARFMHPWSVRTTARVYQRGGRKNFFRIFGRRSSMIHFLSPQTKTCEISISPSL